MITEIKSANLLHPGRSKLTGAGGGGYVFSLITPDVKQEKVNL